MPRCPLKTRPPLPSLSHRPRSTKAPRSACAVAKCGKRASSPSSPRSPRMMSSCLRRQHHQEPPPRQLLHLPPTPPALTPTLATSEARKGPRLRLAQAILGHTEPSRPAHPTTPSGRTDHLSRPAMMMTSLHPDRDAGCHRTSNTPGNTVPTLPTDTGIRNNNSGTASLPSSGGIHPLAAHDVHPLWPHVILPCRRCQPLRSP